MVRAKYISATANRDSKAVSSAKYNDKANSKKIVVWQKNHELFKQQNISANQQNFAIKQDINLPFRQYNEELATVSRDLSVNLEPNIDLEFIVAVKGDYSGQNINEFKVVKIPIALNDPAYSLSSKYSDSYSKSLTEETESNNVWWRKNSQLISILLVILAIALEVSCWRVGKNRSASNSPYQKELSRIYRYHDGVIINTSQPIQLKGRETIVVDSFDDLLNLSDELRSPIIANQISYEATVFVVLYEQIIYSYLVGELIPDDVPVPKKKKKWNEA